MSKNWEGAELKTLAREIHHAVDERDHDRDANGKRKPHLVAKASELLRRWEDLTGEPFRP